MARREAAVNEFIIQDHLSDTELKVYYRQPTTEERQAYINNRHKRVGDEYVDNSVAGRVAGGKAIITGVGEGDFERLEGEGHVPVTPDQKDWKEWMEANAADVLQLLAVRVFERSLGAPAPKKGEVKESLKNDSQATLSH